MNDVGVVKDWPFHNIHETTMNNGGVFPLVGGLMVGTVLSEQV
jgi:hypothetical protein